NSAYSPAIGNWRLWMQIQRGRPSLASKMTVPISVRAERPPPPAELSAAERELWQHLVLSRRPGWFAGSESLLQSFVTATIHCQAIEAELRKMVPRADGPYERLARLHRQAISQCTALARALRLTVNSRLDRNLRHDGDVPLMDTPPPRNPRLRTVRDNSAGT